MFLFQGPGRLGTSKSKPDAIDLIRKRTNYSTREN